MAETTNPTPGVDSGSDEAAMASLMQRFSEPATTEEPQESAPPETAQATEDQAASAEPTADDLPDPPASPTSEVDAFEIVHDGQQRRLTREETIKYAQQGFDYTQKTQRLAEQYRLAEAIVAKAKEVEQLTPQVAQDLALATTLEQQLGQYTNVDWVALATNNPTEYPRYRAQYDQLVSNYQKAVTQLNQKRQALERNRGEITAQTVQQEMSRLVQKVPEFADAARFQKAAADIRTYLLNEGVPEEAVDNLRDANAVAIAFKAMRYDQLVKQKGEKVKALRTAPPVTRPGSQTTQGQARSDQDRDLMGRFRRSGDVKDAAAVLLNRWK